MSRKNLWVTELPLVKIRALKMSDYEDIIKLWMRSDLPFRKKGRDSKTMMRRHMIAYPELFIGAFATSKLVGVVIGSYDGRMKGWINRLAVDPAYRREGIASRLILELEKNLRKLGARIFCALVKAPNKNSLSLFKKIGYEINESILYVSKRQNIDL
jgi:ribosomal protein S18 acetylase RimI-like enzyme